MIRQREKYPQIAQMEEEIYAGNRTSQELGDGASTAVAWPLVTYYLSIDEDHTGPFVSREILRYRRGSKGQPWKFLDFARGEGEAVINEPDTVRDEGELERERQALKSPDILARYVSDGTIKMFAYLIHTCPK